MGRKRTRKRLKFDHGDLAKIAKNAGISPQRLTNYLKGRRTTPADVAEKLKDAAKEMGYETSVFDWIFIKETENKLFKKWRG